MRFTFIGFIIRIYVITIILYFTLTFNGCFDGLIKYRLNEGNVLFSFNYPSSYEQTLEHIEEVYIDICFKRYNDEIDDREDVFRDESWFCVEVHNSGFLGYLSAEDMMNFHIGNISTRREFKLEEKGVTTIDGIQGEYFVCSYRVDPESFSVGESPRESTYYIGRSAYFDFKGFIWSISMTSVGRDNAEADNAVWDNLTESFQVGYVKEFFKPIP